MITTDPRSPKSPTKRPAKAFLTTLCVLALLTTAVFATPWSSPTADAQAAPEKVDVVNATGVRLNLFIDDVAFDATPEELRVVAGALEFCDSCGTLTFGNHTFRVELKDTGQTVATLDTATTNSPIEPSADFDYSLVIHREGDGYAISLYRDDVSPMPVGETRMEIRNVSSGTEFDYVLTPNGENPSTPMDNRSGTLGFTQWERQHNLIVNDYELRIYEAGAAQTKENLVACQGDLELEGLASVIVYVGGVLVPAVDLDDNDVDETMPLAQVCQQLNNREGAFQRSSFTDGFALRGYTGPQMTRSHSVMADATATESDAGPASPYATTASNVTPTPTPTPTPTVDPLAECDGKVVTINMNLNGGIGTGTPGDDVILGTSGPDVISALEGNDTICAGDGDDEVLGGFGDDTIFGEGGNDRLFGRQGNDTIDGGAGDDTVHGNKGDDLLRGGDGADRIYGYADDDELFGGPGNDRMHGNFGNDRMFGEAGDDRMFGYGDNDEMSGGDGNDLMGGNFGDDIIDGNDGDDNIFGSAGADTVRGGNGNDFVGGNSNADAVEGGPGNDALDGGIGFDFCNGGTGNDSSDRCENVVGVP